MVECRAVVKTSAGQLLKAIAGDVRALEAENRLFDTEQRELALLATLVESLVPAATPEQLEKLADTISNAAFMAGDGEFSELLTRQQRRIRQFLAETAPEKEVRRVMIVADAAPTRGLLRTVLERHGFVVTAVEDELDAMATLEREGYCLIIVDLTTRRVSGVDVIRKLAARNVSAPVLVTMATNEPPSNDLDPTIVRAILRKPFDFERVAEIASAICDDSDSAADIAARQMR